MGRAQFDKTQAQQPNMGWRYKSTVFLRNAHRHVCFYTIMRAGTSTINTARLAWRFTRLPFNFLPFGVALIGLVGTLALCHLVVARERAQLQRRTEAEAKHVAGQIQSGVLQRFDPLHRLGVWWLSQGRPLATRDWQTDAQLFLSATVGLKQVLWITANGRQVWSVRPGAAPEVSTSQLAGPELKTLAAAARRLNSVVVSGVFTGDTGAAALYACAPVSQ